MATAGEIDSKNSATRTTRDRPGRVLGAGCVRDHRFGIVARRRCPVGVRGTEVAGTTGPKRRRGHPEPAS
jgi:hypothetical protein